jgi:hypothetical protein
MSSGAPITPSALIEASQFVDNTVLAAWVAQSGLNFVTDANALQELSAAGISSEVTDAMVTVAANSRDVYDKWAGVPGWKNEAGQYWDQDTGMRVYFTEYDPWGMGLGMWGYGNHYTRYALGTNDWSWLYGSSLGFNGLGRVGFTESNVGSMLPPTIVLHNNPTNTESRGRSEKADNADQPKPTSDGILAKAINTITGKGDSSKPPTSPSKQQ